MTRPQPDPFDRPLTQRDLDLLPDDGNRYEIIDGALHVTPFPTSAHQHAVAELLLQVMSHVKARGLGHVFPPGVKVVLDEPTGVGPDLVYISRDRLGGLADDGYHGAPDLVVEVLSSRPALDQIVKKDKYARAGIPHYWIVDPAERRFWAYELRGGRYALLADRGGDETFEPACFPGLTIDLSELWLWR